MAIEFLACRFSYGIRQCQQCTIRDNAVSQILQSHDIVRLQ